MLSPDHEPKTAAEPMPADLARRGWAWTVTGELWRRGACDDAFDTILVSDCGLARVQDDTTFWREELDAEKHRDARQVQPGRYFTSKGIF